MRHRLSREDRLPEASEFGTRRENWPRAILIAGPTASGKSALAMRLAQRLRGIIVNCDSMQVYADLRIITARPRPAEEELVPHRLFGHIDAARNWSAGLWLNDVHALLRKIDELELLPIFVGGTGLYFKALTQGLSSMPQVPPEVRDKVRAMAADEPSLTLHAQLLARDPETAARLRPSDRQRIVRALEVFEASGRPLAEWQEGKRDARLLDIEECVALFLNPDRDKLRARIDERLETMLAEGALEEVAALGRRGLDPALPAMRAHGVPWLLAHLRGEIGLSEAAREAKADTRRYAKRQFTWFRHQMPGWMWHSPEGAEETVLAAAEALRRGRELA